MQDGSATLSSFSFTPEVVGSWSVYPAAEENAAQAVKTSSKKSKAPRPPAPAKPLRRSESSMSLVSRFFFLR